MTRGESEKAGFRGSRVPNAGYALLRKEDAAPLPTDERDTIPADELHKMAFFSIISFIIFGKKCEFFLYGNEGYLLASENRFTQRGKNLPPPQASR